jgi:hypothetical protein
MEFFHFFINMEQPARSCPRPSRLARPPSAAPQANAGRAWLVGELVMAGGSNTLTLGTSNFSSL